MSNKIKLELGFMRHKTDMPHISQEIVDYAIANNQAYFETCYFYLNNKCEDFIYSLLTKYNREDYELCGKMPVRTIMEQYGVKAIFEEQCDKVPGGYFDIYLLQAVDESNAIILKEQNVIPYLLQQKKSGKIKRLGISIQCTPEIFEQYLKFGCWDIIQMPLNFYDWHCCRGNELYELAKKYGIPIIAQAPMKGGLLTKLGDGSTKFAIDFLRNLEGIEYILTGTSKLSTYKDTLKCLTDPIKYTDTEEWLVKLKDYLNSTKIKCIQCGRCYNICDHNIPITALFNLYNKCIDLDSSDHIQYFNSMDLLKSNLSKQLDYTSCNKCKRCNSVCPVGLNIPEILRKDIWEIRT